MNKLMDILFLLGAIGGFGLSQRDRFQSHSTTRFGTRRCRSMRASAPSLLFAVLILCGCGRTSPTSSGATTQLVSVFGTHHDTVTGWTIRVSETNGIHIGPRTNSTLLGAMKFASTVSPSGWKAHPGWFAYAESAERVWMFDGQHKILVLEATPKNWRIYKPPLDRTPPEVLDRLPKALRESVGKQE